MAGAKSTGVQFRVSAPLVKFGPKNEIVEGTIWHNIGIATAMNDGTVRLRIRSVPLAWDGVAVLFPQKEDEEKDA